MELTLPGAKIGQIGRLRRLRLPKQLLFSVASTWGWAAGPLPSLRVRRSPAAHGVVHGDGVGRTARLHARTEGRRHARPRHAAAPAMRHAREPRIKLKRDTQKAKASDPALPPAASPRRRKRVQYREPGGELLSYFLLDTRRAARSPADENHLAGALSKERHWASHGSRSTPAQAGNARTNVRSRPRAAVAGADSGLHHVTHTRGRPRRTPALLLARRPWQG